jgi:hypothetical protein
MNILKSIIVSGALALVSAQSFSQVSPLLGMLQLPTLLAPACEAVPVFNEVPVFESPDGLRIGKLTLDRPDWVEAPEPGCSAQPQLVFQVDGQEAQHPVAISQLSKTLPAMAVYQEEQRNSGMWVQGRHRWGGFWVNANRAGQYLSLHRDMVQGLSRLSETCDNEGRCQPAPANWDKMLQQANAVRQAQGAHGAYEILGIERTGAGRMVYVAKLSSGLRQFVEKGLPIWVRVPVIDYRGRWTGFFIPG